MRQSDKAVTMETILKFGFEKDFEEDDVVCSDEARLRRFLLRQKP